MPTTIHKVEDPCQECRDRHLKCDDDRPKCKQCTRLGEDCHRSKAKPKFRFGSSAKYDQTFSKDQIWLAQSKNAKLQFVDQGPELENYYAADGTETSVCKTPPTRSRTPPNSSETVNRSPSSELNERSPLRQSNHNSDVNVFSPTSIPINSILQHPPKRQRTNDHGPQSIDLKSNALAHSDQEPTRFYVMQDHSKPFHLQQNVGSPDVPDPVKRKVYAEYQRIEDSNAAQVPAEELLSPAIWKEYFFWPNQFTTIQCTCLMRYYIDHLGPWLDIGDPLRNFTLTVPQRARRCPPLLNAIFTIAARHLFGIPRFRSSKGGVQYGRNRMPRLDEGQAIKYQNASIAYLKELCNHPEYVHDEDLLAATVILRYYEELDTALGSEQAETVMRPFQLFVTVQSYPSLPSPLQCGTFDFNTPGTYTSVRQEIEPYLRSYQHAAFRIALRQECTRAFMKQQPIGIDLQAWTILEGFDEAEDHVWADRHLYHLARVLQFCFDNDSRGQQYRRRWEALKLFEELWEENKPASFAAIHYKKPDRSAGEVLPEIWYLAEVHALATQYLDLSRILLAVYDPMLPRIGPGAALAQKRTSNRIREAVVQLCGIAVSMSGCEPALLQACMAVALCGEHFSDRLEQEVLLSLLSQLQNEHGIETSATVESLKQSWSW